MYPCRIDNEYNDEYDYGGGIVYNMDFYDEPRSRLHYDDMPYDSVEETDDAFYSMTDVIYSFPKCKCVSLLFSFACSFACLFVCVDVFCCPEKDLNEEKKTPKGSSREAEKIN